MATRKKKQKPGPAVEPNETDLQTVGGAPPRWFALEDDDECARAVCKLAGELKSVLDFRRQRAVQNLRCYEPYASATMTGYDFVTASLDDEMWYPLHRAGVESVVAQIAGRQKPKPQFLTSGAEWATRRRARKLDKFIEACLHREQAPYQNTWECLEDGFRDALTVSIGTRYVYPGEDGIPVLERINDYELLVDPVEAESGCPVNLFWVHPIDVDRLLDAYCQPEEDETEEQKQKRIELTEAIMGAPDVAVLSTGTPRTTKQVELVRAWRLPLSKKTPGRFVVACNGKLLESKPWKRPRFPFLRQIWARSRIAPWWGISLVEEGATMVDEFNETSRRMQERCRLSAGKRTYYRPGSVKEEDLEANDAEVLIPVEEGHEYPQETMPPPFTEQERQWQQDHVRYYFDFNGISQQQATARKDPGIVSGAAIRTTNDLGTLRLTPKARAYEFSYVQLGRLMCDAIDDFVEENPNTEVTVRYPGKRRAIEQKWSDVRLGDDIDITIAAASQLPNDPAGRLDMVTELFQSGAISMPTYRNLLGWPDLEAEMSTESAEYEYVDELIEQYLDADKATWGDGDYQSPEGFIVDKQHALLHTAGAYFKAKTDKAPEFNLELLRRYIQELDAMIAAAAPAAPAQPTATPEEAPGAPAAA